MSVKQDLTINIQDYINKQKSCIDKHLQNIFNDNKNFSYPNELWNAVKYSVLDSGKRVRGILCLATHESINNTKLQDCLTTASAIELMHAMSLIHDDLPSMDNDDLRRGKPSCHKAFGEANAILAGDALLSLTFQLITEYTKEITSDQKLKIINILSQAFTFGLVPGQVLDLTNENKDDLQLTEKIYSLKTAELIKASILCGAVIALESHPNQDKQLNHISSFGSKIGIAFQIIDDILDITGDTKTLGKTSGKDKAQKKGTYPMLLGIEKSKAIATKLIEEAKSELKHASIDNQLLPELANYIIRRIN